MGGWDAEINVAPAAKPTEIQPVQSDPHTNYQRPQVWTCIDTDLKPFDCGRQTAGGPNTTATAAAGRATAAAPSNSACGLKVKIPPLSSKYDGMGSIDWDLWGLLAAGVVAAAGAAVRWRGRGGGGAAAGAGAGGAARRGGVQQRLLDA